MAHVIDPSGRDLGDVTELVALNYYRREPGFTIDGDTVEPPAVLTEPLEIETADGVITLTPPVVVDDVERADSVPAEAPVAELPARSASKADWVAYAKFTDPGNAAAIDEMTKADLLAAYADDSDDQDDSPDDAGE